MRKTWKRKMVLAMTVLLLAIIMIGAYIILFTYRISFQNAELVTYPDFQITQETVDVINDKNLLDDSGIFNDIWEIEQEPEGNYGELFEIILRYNVRRYVKRNDYVIEKSVDFSGLSKEEKIFFAKSTGLPGDKVFASTGDERNAPTYIDLWGYTGGKSVEEIEKIISKLKIVFIVQHENGKIEKKTVDVEDINIEQREADVNDMDTVNHIFTEKHETQE